MIALTRLSTETLTLAGAAAAAAILTPVARLVAIRVGMVDRPAPHKFHQAPTPYLGGAAVVAAVCAVIVAAFVRFGGVHGQVVAIGAGAVLLAVVGLIDDLFVLGMRSRLAAQALAAAGLWMAGVRVTATGFEAIDILLTILAVMAVTNAVNLLDNMDGISTGVVALASLFVLVVAHWQGQRLVGAMAAGLAGAALGFLPYNFNPARIFLGDAGTMFMGFLLSVLLIKLNLDGHPAVVRAGVPILIAGVPLFDMALVVISRRRAGRPVFRGGTDHSSHRLVTLGRTTAGAAMITYAGTVVTGGAALIALRVTSLGASWGIVGGMVAVGVVLLVLFERVAIALPSLAAPPAPAPIPQNGMVSSARSDARADAAFPTRREQA